MSARFRTYEQMSLLDTASAISSQESVDGLTLCNSRECQNPQISGQEVARANRFQSLENEKEQTTSAMSGRSSHGLSESANLQRALANRLRAAMDVNGSPEYSLTWKEWAMPSREPICALRASARRTSDSGCIGWLTPSTVQIDPTEGRFEKRTEYRESVGRHWTPGCLAEQVSGFLTPKAHDAVGRSPKNDDLTSIVNTFGWPTATTRDHKDGTEQSCENVPVNCLLGRAVHLTSAETEKRDGYRLNPRFSLWLMGYPEEWACCGERAMQSFRNVRLRLSHHA